MGFFNRFIANQREVEKNDMFPESIVVKFNGIIVGNLVLTNNLIELGTINLG